MMTDSEWKQWVHDLKVAGIAILAVIVMALVVGAGIRALDHYSTQRQETVGSLGEE